MKMRLIQYSLPVFTLVLAISCSAAEDDEPFDPASLQSTLTPQCEAELSSFLLQVHGAKACSTAADCVFVAGKTPVFEHCAAGYYVNATADFFDDSSGMSAAAQAEATLQPCFDPISLSGCLGLPEAPICWQAKCYARPVGVSPVACLANMDDTADCSECLCGTCTGHVSKCLADPGCAELLACVKKSGALGRHVAPLPLGSGGLCAELVDKWGGASSSAVHTLQGVAGCNRDKGCFALCD